MPLAGSCSANVLPSPVVTSPRYVSFDRRLTTAAGWFPAQPPFPRQLGRHRSVQQTRSHESAVASRGADRRSDVGWTIIGAAVALLSVVGIGWGTRRHLDRASHSADPEKARIAQEINRQIDQGRGRGTNGWL